MAVANYLDNEGHYPPAWVADENGQPLLSWRVLLLPYLDGQELFEQFHLDEPWDSPHNRTLLPEMSPVLRLHSRKSDEGPYTDYVAIVGDATVWQGPEPRPADFVTDEVSSTLLIAEHVGRRIPWTKPEDLLFSEMNMEVDSDDGICSLLTPPAFVAVDASLHVLPKDTKEDELRALLTARGGEPGRDFPYSHDGRLRPRKPA